MTSVPGVCAVILNYNLADYTIACVRSLRKVTYPSLEILVLDNASTEGDVQKISGALPGLSLRSSPRNTGYTGGINAGVRWAMESSPEYVLVLNPDTEVQPDFLDHLVSAMESHPRAAVACGTIYKSHQPGEAWYAGGRMIPWRGLAVHEGKGETIAPGDLGEPRPVTFVTGCMALYRTRALGRIGGQDERFFLYLDDIEMSARIVRTGYELLYVPKAVIRHHVKGEEENPFKLYYSVRNRLLLIRTAFSGLERAAASLYFAGVITVKMLAWLAVNRTFFRAAAMGMEDFFRGRFGEGRGLQAFSPRGGA
jgi:GT2 family glycosyltransferase